VPLITVFWGHNIRGQDKAPDQTEEYGWDTHNDIFDSLRDHLLPRFDQSFATLLTDLHERGLLDSTLVVCLGEFGRAPLVALEPKFAGSSPGRKHWAGVYSAVLAGAGVGRGAIVGASDRSGGAPQSDAVGPWDMAATMFAALGIDPAGHYTDPEGRPYAITTGRPIDALYR
jgi:arylsulfatase A-like enzyme